MPITTNIPETITRDAYLALIRGAGLDPRHIKSLEFRPDGIYATVHVHDDDGRIVVDGDQIATHTVYVRVVNGD